MPDHPPDEPPRHHHSRAEAMEWFLARTRKPGGAGAVGAPAAPDAGGVEPAPDAVGTEAGDGPRAHPTDGHADEPMHGQHAPAEALVPHGTERTARVLSMRALVTYQLARWPECDPGEPEQSVERLAQQGRQLLVPVETLIVELRQLVDKHAIFGTDVTRGRALRDALVSRLIAAYYR